jgi:hypothetical protein
VRAHDPDEVETAVERVENLAVDRRDPVAQVC